MRVHHNLQVKGLCKNMDIPLIFNLPYRPEFNPIENVFSLVKNTYKRLKINAIVKDKKFNAKKLVKSSFNQLNKDIVGNICRSGRERIVNGII